MLYSNNWHCGGCSEEAETNKDMLSFDQSDLLFANMYMESFGYGRTIT